MGISTYLGIMPLGPILANDALQVVSDWTIVSDHVTHIRKRPLSVEEIPFLRLYGEWLALMCYEWGVSKIQIRCTE